MKKKFAVILAGCGKNDGSEIHESVLTLLSIVQVGASYQCYSLNKDQHRVFNHLTNLEEKNQKRNMLVESARIARGDIKEISELKVKDYDVLVIPGGNGVAYNFFNLGYNQNHLIVDESISNICKDFTAAKKPVGFICIAPAMIPLIYGDSVEFTIGSDADLIKTLNYIGANHKIAKVTDVVVDINKKIFSTPAYMLAKDINEVFLSIKNLINRLLVE